MLKTERDERQPQEAELAKLRTVACLRHKKSLFMGGIMKKLLLLIALLMFVAAPLLAQEEFPRAQVFGGYSYVSFDTSGLTSRQNFNGWNGQATFNLNRWFGLTGDFGGYYGDISKASLHDYSYLFGPTVTFRAEHVAPFVHALFGGSHIGGSGFGTSGSDNAFAMAVGGGLDLSFQSGFGIRLAQADWYRTSHLNETQNNVRVSTGVFFNFGK
jgi:Outer membrane protein beta-barrel domain